MMKNFVAFLLVLMSMSVVFVRGNAIVHRGDKLNSACGERIYVEDSTILDAPTNDDCTWEIEAEKNKILVFSLVDDGKFEEALKYFAIHDGFNAADRVLDLENQGEYGYRRNNSQAIYTTSSAASVRFVKSPTSSLRIRISKAVQCLSSIGQQTDCGRIVDDTSCYCIIYTSRSQPDQANVCAWNGMKLLSIESRAEEQAIRTRWGANSYWTSLTDIANEGEWIWESTNSGLVGYTNWGYNQPDNAGGNENCMKMDIGFDSWSDRECTTQFWGVCENQP